MQSRLWPPWPRTIASTCSDCWCRRDPKGMPAGAVAEALRLAPNTLTFHFDRLRQAGLVTVRREGRSMIYAARYEQMNALVGFLTENCCRGAPSARAPSPLKSSRNKRAKIPA